MNQSDISEAIACALQSPSSSPIRKNKNVNLWETVLRERIFVLFGSCKQRIFNQLKFIMENCEKINIQKNDRNAISFQLFNNRELDPLDSIYDFYRQVKCRLDVIRLYLIELWTNEMVNLEWDIAYIQSDAKTIAEELFDIGFLMGANITLPAAGGDESFNELEREINNILKSSAHLLDDVNRQYLLHLRPILNQIEKAAFYIQSIVIIETQDYEAKMAISNNISATPPQVIQSPTKSSIRIKSPDMKKGWHTKKSSTTKRSKSIGNIRLF